PLLRRLVAVGCSRHLDPRGRHSFPTRRSSDLTDETTGRTHPAILVGTRVVVPGGGSYDLFLVFSLEEEQETLSFVQRVLLGGGGVMMALVVGIAIVVARLVTTPLKRAARAAERMADGDLTSRVEVSGADELARVGESFNDMARNLEQ